VEGIVLFVYGDESMDESQQRVCAVAGLIGPEEEWKRFESSWRERNAGIPFHAKDCETDQGDYKGRPHKENKALYRDLAIMLAESSLAGFAAVSDLQAERRHFPDLPMLYLREFLHVIDGMQFFAGEHGEMAELCFDNRTETNFNAMLMYAQAQAVPGWKQRLPSRLLFESSANNPRIQVADLFAHEAMKWLDNQIGPVKRDLRKSLAALTETRRFCIQAFLEPFFAEERAYWEQRPRMAIDRYTEYLAWLATRNRQHNLTSIIEFVNSHPPKL
jgi:Protein of unknown function (DUF3800)